MSVGARKIVISKDLIARLSDQILRAKMLVSSANDRDEIQQIVDVISRANRPTLSQLDNPSDAAILDEYYATRSELSKSLEATTLKKIDERAYLSAGIQSAIQDVISTLDTILIDARYFEKSQETHSFLDDLVDELKADDPVIELKVDNPEVLIVKTRSNFDELVKSEFLRRFISRAASLTKFSVAIGGSIVALSSIQPIANVVEISITKFISVTSTLVQALAG